MKAGNGDAEEYGAEPLSIDIASKGGHWERDGFGKGKLESEATAPDQGRYR